MPLLDAERLFRDEPELRAVVVVTDDPAQPGLLHRERLDGILAGRLGYGRALHTRAGVSTAVDHDPLLLAPDATLEAVAAAMLARPRTRRFDDALQFRSADGLPGASALPGDPAPPADPTLHRDALPAADGVGPGPVRGRLTEVTPDRRPAGRWYLITATEVVTALAAHHAGRAETDALTRLPNRVAITSRLTEAVDARRPISVAFVDLDGFKAVNDGLGHATGDAVLAVFGQRLRAALGPTVLLGRLAGDEFVLLCPDEATAVAAGHIAVDTAMATPAAAGLSGVRLGASAGVASSRPGDTPDTLLNRADTALYRAKQARRSVVVFDPARDRAADLLARTEALARAVENEEMTLVYQPVLALGSRQLVAAEALLRWTTPDGDVVPPAEFIPLAESTGLIAPLTRLVLDSACRQARQWLTERGAQAPVVAVNLSAVSLGTDAIVTDVARALAAHDLPGRQLCLELTETAAVANLAATAAVLRQLQDLGCGIALDDFGTGHSSLGVLRSLPVDTVKIDRSLLADVLVDSSAAALVGYVVQLAHGLGLAVTAEGIEAAEQAQLLQQLGCEQGQGYHLGFPGPAEAIGHDPLGGASAPTVVQWRAPAPWQSPTAPAGDLVPPTTHAAGGGTPPSARTDGVTDGVTAGVTGGVGADH